ncbi:TPA: hypothetical protein ACPZLH_002467 [Yersinia enterocolitica]
MGKVRSITVSLNFDVGDFNQGKIINAIEMIKGVSSAHSVITLTEDVPDLMEVVQTHQTLSILVSNGIECTEVLLGKTERDLIRMEYLGKKRITEIKDGLAKHNLSLKKY